MGKAVASFVPAIAVSYLTFGVFLAIVELFAEAPVATAMWHAPQLPAEVLLIPLLAAGAIWIGLAISSKVSETRVAQQLSVLGSLPPLALISLMSFQVITPSFALAAALAVGLLVIDCAACFGVARLFDRERPVTGTRPSRSASAPAATPGAVRRLLAGQRHLLTNRRAERWRASGSGG